MSIEQVLRKIGQCGVKGGRIGGIEFVLLREMLYKWKPFRIALKIWDGLEHEEYSG